MSFIHRHKGCTGVTLLNCLNTKLELWFLPAGHSVEPHSHTSFRSNIFILFGKGLSCKIVNGVTKKTTKIRKLFGLRENTVHWFESQSQTVPTIFINLERWSTTPTSASEDFVKYETPTQQ